MAPRLDKNTDVRGDEARSDTSNRKTVIAQSFERMYAIDREIAAITKAEIEDLRGEKSDIKKRLREQFQMPAKLVQARYYFYWLEQEAGRSDDGVTMDAIREMFEVLPIGGQGDLVSALERTHGKSGSLKEAPAEGVAASKGGRNCEPPYADKGDEKPLREAWVAGWMADQS